mgnify:CR=1 FL=1
MKDLLIYLVGSIVNNPDSVSVNEDALENGSALLRLTVHPDDMGGVIGKGGKIINSIRQIVRVVAIRQGKHVTIELEEASPNLSE